MSTREFLVHFGCQHATPSELELIADVERKRILSVKGHGKPQRAGSPGPSFPSQSAPQPSPSPFGGIDPNAVNGSNHSANGTSAPANASSNSLSFQFGAGSTPNSNSFSSQISAAPTTSTFSFGSSSNINSAVSGPNTTQAQSSFVQPNANQFSFGSPQVRFQQTSNQQAGQPSNQFNFGSSQVQNQQSSSTQAEQPRSQFNFGSFQGQNSQTQNQQAQQPSNFFSFGSTQSQQANQQPAAPFQFGANQKQGIQQPATASSSFFKLNQNENQFNFANQNQSNQPQTPAPNLFNNSQTLQANNKIVSPPDAEMISPPNENAERPQNLSEIVSAPTSLQFSSNKDLAKNAEANTSAQSNKETTDVPEKAPASTSNLFSSSQPSSSNLFSPIKPSTSNLFSSSQPNISKTSDSTKSSTSNLFSSSQPSTSNLFSSGQPSTSNLFGSTQPSPLSVVSTAAAQPEPASAPLASSANTDRSPELADPQNKNPADMAAQQEIYDKMRAAKSTKDRVDSCGPPSIPEHLNEAEKKEYIFGFKLMMATRAFKTDVLNCDSYGLRFDEIIDLHRATRNEVFLQAGVKRKALHDGAEEVEGPSKRPNLSGPPVSGAASKTPLFGFPTAEKRSHEALAADPAPNEEEQDESPSKRLHTGAAPAELSNHEAETAEPAPKASQPLKATSSKSTGSNLFGAPAQQFAFSGTFKPTTTSTSTSSTSSAPFQSVLSAPLSESNAPGQNIFEHLSQAGSDVEGSKAGDADGEQDDESDEESEEDGEAENESKAKEASNEPATPPVQSTTPTGRPPSRSLFDRIEMDANGNPKRGTPPPSDLEKQKQAELESLLPEKFRKSSGEFLRHSVSRSPSPSPGASSNLFGSDSGPKTPAKRFVFSTDGNADEPQTGTSQEGQKGDHTWTPETPIKFGGASTAPSVSITSPSPTKPAASGQKLTGSLFGLEPQSNKTPSLMNPFAHLAGTPSALGAANPSGQNFRFQFGGPKPEGGSLTPSVFASGNTSRATSPGATTGEESNAEEAGAAAEEMPKEEQLDLTSANAGEEQEDVLFQLRARASEYALRGGDEGEAGQGDDEGRQWMVRGVGELKLLKDKESGAVRVTMRAGPNAKVVLNSRLVPGLKYDCPREKTVNFHVVSKEGKVERWLLQVKTKEDAEQLSQLLNTHKG